MNLDCTAVQITSDAARLLSEYLVRISEPSVVVVTHASSGSHRDKAGHLVPDSPGWVVGFSAESRVTAAEIMVVDGFKVLLDPRGLFGRIRIVVRDGVLGVDRLADA